MKTSRTAFPWGGAVLLTIFCFVLVATYSRAQTAQPAVYARVVFHKVTPGQEAEFEKLIKENIKPMADYRKKNGVTTAWRFYKVHFKTAEDKYNYVSVTYFDSWAKTETMNVPEVMKAANPKVDPAPILAKIGAIRQNAGEAIYYREDITVSKSTAAPKYVVIDFMKVKNNLFDEYLKVEKEDWKPVHQALVDDGKRAGWAFWSLVMPGGLEQGHEYVTSNAFATYEQIMAGNYADAFKKAHPGKEPQPYLDRAAKARDQVRSELWELVDSL